MTKYRTDAGTTLCIYNENVEQFNNKKDRSKGGGNAILRPFRVDSPPYRIDATHYAVGIPTMQPNVDNTTFDNVKAEIANAFAVLDEVVIANPALQTVLWSVEPAPKTPPPPYAFQLGLSVARNATKDSAKKAISHIQADITHQLMTFASSHRWDIAIVMKGQGAYYRDGKTLIDRNIKPFSFAGMLQSVAATPRLDQSIRVK